jgi:hypothetical protein
MALMAACCMRETTYELTDLGCCLLVRRICDDGGVELDPEMVECERMDESCSYMFVYISAAA